MTEWKPLVLLRGRPLVRHVLDAAGAVCDELIVVAKREHAGNLVAALGPTVRIVPDRAAVQTPLAGIAAAAEAASARYLAVLGCDTPLLRPVLLRTLFERAGGAAAAVPRWPDGRLEPLVAVYETTALHRASRKAIGEGKRASQDLLPMLSPVRFVSAEELRSADPDLRSFHNVNTPEDLRRAAAWPP